MKCKFCGAELETENLICPACSKDNTLEETPVEEGLPEEKRTEESLQEETAQEIFQEELPQEDEESAPRKKRWKAVVAIVCCVVLLLGLAAGVAIGMGIDLKPRANDIHYKDCYAVEEAELTESAMSKVIATVGDKQLTNRQLQVFYWMQFYNFMDEYSYYLSSFGLDYTKPLSEQTVPNTEATWEQYFLDLALSTWHRYQVLAIEAEKTGFTMAEDMDTLLEQVKDGMEQSVQSYGIASVDELVKEDMGPGSDEQSYLDYIAVYYQGVSYFESLYDQAAPTEEEIKAYFLEHAADYEQYGVSIDSGNVVDVRHILFCPQGGTVNEDNTVTYSEEEWAACLAKAQAALDSWKAGDATEESFGLMAAEQTEDPGSQSTGGLYTSVYKGQMMEAFDNWCFDESRKSGDTGLVQTPYGYHVMYFVGAELGWYRYGREGLVNNICTQQLNELLEATPMDVKYKHILLGQVDFSSAE